MTRRSLLAGALALPSRSAPPVKVVVAGGHPGDPECGCGGTVARLAELGHDVVLLYLNRGEGFCGDAPLDRCAAIRTAEAQSACRILKARAAFAGQVDGQGVLDSAHYAAFSRVLAAESPDLVLTQWAIDRHPDHRVISMLTLDAWWKADRKFALYFYEVAEDTTTFAPTDYVDITAAEGRRRAACYAHASQRPEKWYPKQVELTRRRGVESGVGQAEAFLRHPESRRGPLPG
jgi:LmbE family N-acetylglucosaminyl deacetylase